MKLLGCVCLVAGTAIGGGMLALPIALAKFGLLLSVVILLGTWGLSYLSALLSLELNLRAGKGLPLGALGKRFGGVKSYLCGSISLAVLCYSLLCAYIYAAAATFTRIENFPLSFRQTACVYAACLFALMLCSLKKVDVLNRFLFAGKVLVTLIIIFAVLFELNFASLPLAPQTALSQGDFYPVLPIVFTSFGFQVVFHTLVNYTNGDKAMLKKAFFWGSLLPAVLYVAWVFVVCGLIYAQAPDLFKKTLVSTVEIGDLFQVLYRVNGSPIVKYLTLSIGFFAILTSTIGVSLGLIDALKTKHSALNKHVTAVSAAIAPALVVAIAIPGAFMKALSFAGMVLSFMALLLPAYLLFRANREGGSEGEDESGGANYRYPILKNPLVTIIVVIYGLSIIYSEIHNIFLG